MKAERVSEEQEFIEELRRKYDRDMAMLEEEYRKTKALYETVSGCMLTTKSPIDSY